MPSYHKSSGKLFWATPDYTNRDQGQYITNLYYDTADKFSTGLEFKLLYSANSSGRCAIEIDEAAGVLYFMVNSHGIVRISLSGAADPKPWSNLSTLRGIDDPRVPFTIPPLTREARPWPPPPPRQPTQLQTSRWACCSRALSPASLRGCA